MLTTSAEAGFEAESSTGPAAVAFFLGGICAWFGAGYQNSIGAVAVIIIFPYQNSKIQPYPTIRYHTLVAYLRKANFSEPEKLEVNTPRVP